MFGFSPYPMPDPLDLVLFVRAIHESPLHRNNLFDALII